MKLSKLQKSVPLTLGFFLACLFFLCAFFTGNVMAEASVVGETPVNADAAGEKQPQFALNQEKCILAKGETFHLVLSVDGEPLDAKAVSWSSGKKSVASVSKKGKITAKKVGKAVITAKYQGQKITCTVSVTYGLDVKAWIKSGEPLIAHAGGVIYEKQPDGSTKNIIKTNSLEAIWQTIQSGYTVMEMDFCMTSNGKLACLHNWSKSIPKRSLSKWKKYKLEDQYTSMYLASVIQTLKENPLLYLVVDVKDATDAKSAKKLYTMFYDRAYKVGGLQLVNRVIPQIYSREMYAAINEIYEWPVVIYTLYRETELSDDAVIRFIKECPSIQIVTMPMKRVSKEFVSSIHAAGRYVFTHTVDTKKKMKKYRAIGVDGFYTNLVTPAKYRTFGLSL